MAEDWTRGNQGQDFLSVVGDVERILKDTRLGSSLNATARLIVAHLAHRRGMSGPTRSLAEDVGL